MKITIKTNSEECSQTRPYGFTSNSFSRSFSMSTSGIVHLYWSWCRAWDANTMKSANINSLP